MSTRVFITGSLSTILLSVACSRDAPPPRVADPEGPPASAVGPTDPREAEVELKSAEGSEIEGKASLQEDGGGVRITLTVEQAPAGNKGVHIHEIGDCSDIAGKSMGEHFSPGQHQHALPSEGGSDERHLGDMGNILVNDEGKGTLEFVVDRASLRQGDDNSLIGRALVVHEAEDKGAVEQPSGGSGKPIACGVISDD